MPFRRKFAVNSCSCYVARANRGLFLRRFCARFCAMENCWYRIGDLASLAWMISSSFSISLQLCSSTHCLAQFEGYSCDRWHGGITLNKIDRKQAGYAKRSTARQRVEAIKSEVPGVLAWNCCNSCNPIVKDSLRNLAEFIEFGSEFSRGSFVSWWLVVRIHKLLGF